MITSINFSKLIEALLPPDRRTYNTVKWNSSLSNEVQIDSDDVINIYKKGAIQTIWSAGTYSINEVVRYSKTIYRSTSDLNIDIPSQTQNWVVVSENFIGVDDRLRFTGEKLTLEFALNEWFDTVFRQPPFISDIFINVNPTVDTPFSVGNSEEESSVIYSDRSSEFIVDSFDISDTFYNMVIYVPNATLASLALDIADQLSIIRHFADKYVNAGITYNVIGY